MYYYLLTLLDEYWNLFWCWNRSVQKNNSAFILSFFCFIPECTCVGWHQILVFAVLGGWELELSYILSYICCFQHYWLCEEFPWVDEWFHSKVFWTNPWKYISFEVSGVFLNLYWEQDIHISILGNATFPPYYLAFQTFNCY